MMCDVHNCQKESMEDFQKDNYKRTDRDFLLHYWLQRKTEELDKRMG
jgi:hypothetical protein